MRTLAIVLLIALAACNTTQKGQEAKPQAVFYGFWQGAGGATLLIDADSLHQGNHQLCTPISFRITSNGTDKRLGSAEMTLYFGATEEEPARTFEWGLSLMGDELTIENHVTGGFSIYRRVPEEVIKEASVRANRDALTNDLVNLASRAQQYYRRKVSMGGGDGTFVGLTADDVGIAKLTSKVQDKNGTYSIIKTGDETSVKLEGLGTQKGTDGSFLKVQMTVFAESTAVTFVN